MKPQTGCQGNGIFLTRSPDKVPTDQKLVVSEYLSNPLLIDGFKFDMRLYVLLYGSNPLRVFLFKDGLIRLCTKQYKPPSKANYS